MAQVTAKAKLTSLKTLVTPDGIAAFPKLVKPDDTFGDPKFQITVVFDKKSPEFKQFVKVLMELNFKYLVDQGKMKAAAKKKPIPKCIKVLDEKLAKKLGMDVGAPYIRFETKFNEGDGPIPVFAADGSKTHTRVYGTDLVAIETNVVGWLTGSGIGIKCYLGAVQLLESRWSGGRANAGSNFGTREEYIKDDEDETIDAPDESGLAEEDIELDDDDDLGLGEDDDPAGGLV